MLKWLLKKNARWDLYYKRSTRFHILLTNRLHCYNTLYYNNIDWNEFNFTNRHEEYRNDPITTSGLKKFYVAWFDVRRIDSATGFIVEATNIIMNRVQISVDHGWVEPTGRRDEASSVNCQRNHCRELWRSEKPSLGGGGRGPGRACIVLC